MKYLVYLFILSYLPALCACSEHNDAPKPQYIEHIQSISVLQPKVKAEVEIDIYNRTITIICYSSQAVDLSQVKLQFSLIDGAQLITPTETNPIFNLSDGKEEYIKIKYNGEEVVYLLTADTRNIPLDPTILGWKECSEFGQLPAYLKVYRSPERLVNKKVVAYLAVADMNKAAFFNVLGEKSGTGTPSQFYAANRQPHIVMNAGFFAGKSTVSLICRNSKLIAPNILSLSRPLGTYYPTRSVFGLMKNMKYEVHWVYTTDSNTGLTYSYPSPAANSPESAPLSRPNADFPEGASEWSGITAIGGGPVLIKDGKIQNTWQAEMIDAASGVSVSQKTISYYFLYAKVGNKRPKFMD